MKKLTLGITLLLAGCISTFSQDPLKKYNAFVSKLNLQKVTQKDSINNIKKEINSILSTETQKKGKYNFFNFFRRWEFSYCLSQGYKENFPGAFKDTNTSNSFERKGELILLKGKNKMPPTTGLKLFNKFNVSKIKFPITYFPTVYARNSRFNDVWTAILIDKKNLIIRYVSSYPDGNQSSWYNEVAYFFKRH
jgi:hypothetical protein